MPSPYRARRVVGLLAGATIGMSTAVLGAPGVASAAPTTWSFSDADRSPIVVPAGICAIEWSIIGSKGGAGAPDDPLQPPIGTRTRTLVSQGETFTLSVGAPGADADDGGAGGTNPLGHGVWNGGNGIAGTSGGGGAASVVLRNGEPYLAGQGGSGAGEGGGRPGRADGLLSVPRIPLRPGDESFVSLPQGELQGYIRGEGLACGTFVNPDVPTPLLTSVVPGPGQLYASFLSNVNRVSSPPGLAWEYSFDGVRWTRADTRQDPFGPSQLTFSVMGLTNGQEYRMRLRATSSIGTSEVSTAGSPVAPFERPGRPAGATVSAGEGELTVGWTPPTSPGTFPIAGYRVTAVHGTEDGGFSIEEACSADVAARTCTFDVPAGVDYVVYVSAVDSRGTVGDYAVAESGVVPFAPPAVAAPEGDGHLVAASGGPLTRLVAGEEVFVKGSGFAPGSTVRVVVYSTPQELGTFVADENGDVEATVRVPAGLPSGSHSLVVSGVDPDGAVRTLRSDVTVSAPAGTPSTAAPARASGVVPAAATAAAATGTGGSGASTGGLANTGVAVAVPVLGGLAALSVGGGLLFAARRRHG